MRIARDRNRKNPARRSAPGQVGVWTAAALMASLSQICQDAVRTRSRLRAVCGSGFGAVFFALSGAIAAEPQIVTAAMPCVISGTVVGANGRPPEEPAWVELIDSYEPAVDWMHNFVAPRKVETGRGGSFRFAVPPGEYALLGSLGFEGEDSLDRTQVSQVQKVALVPGQKLGGIRLVLGRERTLSGTISGAGLKSDDSLYLCARIPGTRNPCTFRSEQGTGDFKLGPLPAGPLELLLTNRHPWEERCSHGEQQESDSDSRVEKNFYPEQSTSEEYGAIGSISLSRESKMSPLRQVQLRVTVGEKGTSGVRLVLPAGTRLQGSVTPAPNQPNAQLAMYLQPADQVGRTAGRALDFVVWQSLQPWGRLVINLEPGRFELGGSRQLLGRDLGRNLGGRLTFNEKTTSSAQLVLGPGATVTGHVRDAAGLPLKTRVVLLFGGQLVEIQKTAEDGSYRFPGLWAGRFTLQAEVPAPHAGDGGPAARAELTLAAGDKRELELRLAALRTIQGRLLIRKSDERQDTRQDRMRAVVTPRQTHEIHGELGEDDNQFKVTVSGQGRLAVALEYESAVDWDERVVTEPIELTDKTPSPVVLRQLRAARLYGVLRDAAGRPVVNVRIRCGTDIGEQEAQGPLPNGVFWRVCPSGQTRLHITKGDHHYAIPLTLRAKQTSYAAIVLPPTP